MNIDLHILTWNESDIITLVLRHYKKFCRNLYVYDNHSTDNTRELAEAEGAKVTLFGDKFFNDQNNMDVKNNCWRGSDADLVILCDCDEILADVWNIFINDDKVESMVISPLFAEGLTPTATIFKTIGWQIMSEEMPKEDLLEITNGYRFDNYSKSIIFNPKEITEINYGPGAHKCNPTGNVVWSDEALYVLHYKHIGGVQRTIDRYAKYKKRLSKVNRQKGYGIHYLRTPASLREEWAQRMTISRPLI